MKWSVCGGVLLYGALMCAQANASFLSKSSALSADCCAPAPCAPVTPKLVQRTIRVPQWTTETRTVSVTRYRPETHTKTVQSVRCVPYQEAVTRQCTIMVPERHERTITCMVPKPVFDTVQKTFPVCVPHQVQREGVRNVCRMVPVTVQKTVCKDEGHWEERSVHASHCGACGGCGCDACAQPRTCRVWVPNVTQHTVPVTVMRPQMIKQPYSYTCTEYRHEMRTKDVQVCRFVMEPRTKTVPYFVCVPKTVTKTLHLTRYRQEPVTRQVSCTTMVPYEATQEVHVPVCNWVEKTITVNADCALDYCADYCAGGWRGLFRRCW